MRGPRAGKRQSGARRLLHDVAQASCDGQPAAARHGGHFHRQQFATVLGPGQPNATPTWSCLLSASATVAGRAQELLQVVRCNPHPGGAPLHHLARRLAAYGRQLALQLTHPGLAGIGA